MAEPQLIIVNGIPVKTQVEITQKWTLILFFTNLVYFIYQCNLYHEQNRLLATSLSFIMCGVYLPFYGYTAVKKKKHTAIRCFSIILSMISLLVLVSALSSITFYYELNSMCKKCVDIFENETDCDIAIEMDKVLYITKDECTDIPPELTFLIQHLLELLVSIVGFITACTVSQKHGVVQIDASIIDGSIIRTEDVPQIPPTTTNSV
tara:strand:- start:538 stop:1158 length:621 start_codon:yes stop_codon:yes gene_type:complete